MKINNILTPIDFTKLSKAGLTSAVQLAKRLEANVHVVHIIESEAFQEDGVMATADMEMKMKQRTDEQVFAGMLINKKKEQMKQFLSDFKEETVNIIPHFQTGDFITGLDAFLSENQIDMIVQVTTGETSTAELFSGNHAVQVVRKADIPVITVHDDIQMANLDKMVILKDSTMDNLKSFQKLITIGKELEMELYIVHINTSMAIESHDIKKYVQSIADRVGIEGNRVRILSGTDKVDELHTFIKDHKIGLVGTLSKVDSQLLRLIFGSDIEKFINNLEVPVLAVSE
jgi:nucleotide-binding universal stress UspA family protein